MPTRPIFDQGSPGGAAPVPNSLQSSRGHQQESPLASQLPAWDLLPAHTLLVRRRPGALNRPPSRSDVPDRASVPPSMPVSVAATPAPAPPVPALSLPAPGGFCGNCGSQQEEGATFCEDCGSAVSSTATAIFTVILTSSGANKINVIKAVREVTTLDLKEAKDLVDLAPQPVKQCTSKQEADAIKQRLLDVGATAEIR
jgi:ribosomal protein L7/L12